MPPKYVKQRSGFMLTAVLASTAMASLLMIFLGSIIRTASTGQNTIDNHIQYDILHMSLLQLFRNSDLCAASFQNPDGSPYLFPVIPGPSPSPTVLEIRVGGERLAYNGKNLGRGANLTRVQIDIVSGPTVTGSGNYRSAVLVRLSMDKNAQSYGTRTISNDSNPYLLNIETDPTGRVLLCDNEAPVSPPPPPPDPSPSPSPSPSASPPPGGNFDLVGCTTHTVSNGRYQCALGKRAAFVSCSFRETLGRDDVYPRISGRWAYCDGSNAVNSGIALCCTDTP